MDKNERLRRIVQGNRRNAGLKAWDTRWMNEFKRSPMMGKPRNPTEVDGASRSVAKIIHGDGGEIK